MQQNIMETPTPAAEQLLHRRAKQTRPRIDRKKNHANQGSTTRAVCVSCSSGYRCKSYQSRRYASEGTDEVRGQGAGGGGFSGPRLVRFLIAPHRAPHPTEPRLHHQAEQPDWRASEAKTCTWSNELRGNARQALVAGRRYHGI